MTQEEQREQIVQQIADMLRRNPVTFEYVVRKKPKGIKIQYEVTKEQLDAMVSKASEQRMNCNE